MSESWFVPKVNSQIIKKPSCNQSKWWFTKYVSLYILVFVEGRDYAPMWTECLPVFPFPIIKYFSILIFVFKILFSKQNLRAKCKWSGILLYTKTFMIYNIALSWTVLSKRKLMFYKNHRPSWKSVFYSWFFFPANKMHRRPEFIWLHQDCTCSLFCFHESSVSSSSCLVLFLMSRIQHWVFRKLRKDIQSCTPHFCVFLLWWIQNIMWRYRPGL